ncbi:hypothetical protein AMET1_0295 [Methanonatronarchaeum thermophilum]|uniref:Uncharacterized protein n=1 Tax=Methanonatronarchaeum thermophilum TaxID=1927129 RepID=A0A1Y3GB61_9EURY|nr:hypothetical protein [Methanonatronarchaeum thermophilum]OUJ18649.1 hypothetical protein AMET1_0295 [Methanonatronarchaeum thermophilum]
MNRYRKHLKIQQSEVSNLGLYYLYKKIRNKVDVNIYEMKLSKNNNKIVTTPGKIELKFCPDLNWESIARTLSIISEIDNNAHHEITVKMKYNEIERYEKEGYVLVSYGKIEGDQYRVIFEIPFSRTSALKKFALSIYNSNNQQNKDVVWNGGNKRIATLYDELNQYNWKIEKLQLMGEKDIRIEFTDKPQNKEIDKIIEKKIT